VFLSHGWGGNNEYNNNPYTREKKMKILKISVAFSMASVGLLGLSTLPASANAKANTTVNCYEISKTTDQLSTTTSSTGVCPAGYSKGVPTQAQLQGTGNNGDIDLNVPNGASTLNINGSSFDQTLVGVTTTGSSAYPAANFSSYPAVGSGGGRSGIEAGTLNIGFSDQPISAAAGTLASSGTVANTSAEVSANFVQVPYLLGGAVVGYNLPGLKNIRLTASEIAAIYDGTVTKWSNAGIVATNGGPTVGLGKKLAALGTTNAAIDTIKVLYRSASSGTTYAFTDYLNTAGASGHSASGNVMEGSGNKWGASNILGASNNATMASDIVNTPGSIGYVEYSYLLIPGNAAISAAVLQDKNGQWLTPTSTGMLSYIAKAAAAASASITPENFSIVFQAGKDAWPLATYSWAIVAKSQPSQATGEAVVKYLDWESHVAQLLDATANGYVPLPTAAAAYARAQLAAVNYNGTKLLGQQN